MPLGSRVTRPIALQVRQCVLGLEKVLLRDLCERAKRVREAVVVLRQLLCTLHVVVVALEGLGYQLHQA